MEKIIIPNKITKDNFSSFGDIISTKDVKPININEGYAKRFDDLADIDISNDEGKAIVSIFSALKRNFPMKIDMMEKHPLGSQAFIPMRETYFFAFVAPKGNRPNLKKIKSFKIPKQTGINLNPGIWHFPLISTKNMNFLVIDRKGKGKNLIIYKFKKEKIYLSK